MFQQLALEKIKYITRLQTSDFFRRSFLRFLEMIIVLFNEKMTDVMDPIVLKVF